MEQVTHYELTEKCIMIHGDFMEVHSIRPSYENCISLSDGNMLVADMSVEKIRLPIHHVRGYDDDTKFFCISPELQTIISSPFVLEVSNLHRRNEDLTRSVESRQFLLNDIHKDIENFFAMPWWKRVWRVLFIKHGSKFLWEDMP